MPLELLAELQNLGVELSIDADGRLAFEAPANVVDIGLLARMRAQRDGLVYMVLKRDVRYVPPMRGVLCPWCRSSDFLIEHDTGLTCGNCSREAWRFEGSAIVRADWTILVARLRL